MRQLPQCNPGFKRCGTRCVKREYTCAEDRREAPKKEKALPGILKPQNLALLAGGTALFAGITLTAIQASRAPNHPKKLYLKPITPSREDLPDSPQPPNIPLHKRMGITDEILQTDEYDLTPQQRHDKAVRWAQGVVDGAETTFVLDFETANTFEGVNPLTDDYESLGAINPPGIVQIAIHRLDGGESYNVILDPEETINPFSERVHGLSASDVEGQPTFKDIYPFLKETLEGKDLLAFNNRFDVQLFDAMCDKNKLERIKFSNRNEDGLIDNEGDIMHQFALYNGRQPNKKKDLAYAQLPRRADMADQMEGVDITQPYDPYADLPRHNGVKFGEAHDALEDVLASAELIFRMATNSPIRDRRSPKWQTKTGYNESEYDN